MGSNSFILFNDLSEPIMSLTDEEAGKLFKAIFEYRNGGLKQELTGATNISFMFIKQQLDRSEEHYDMICKRNRANGAKGGRPKSKTSNTSKPTGLSGNPTEPNITLPDPYPDPKSDNKKEEKKKYGEYKHVLLTDKQYSDLLEKVDDREKWIKIIDESIEEKGNIYKIKNFYLAIQKWYKRDNGRSEEPSKELEATLERLKASGAYG